ncbi:hypothetical protein MTR67_039319, partial [Solanum verrucosum]
CLESKISGGDPSVLINVFRVKTSGYDSPGPPYGSPRRTPTLGQTSCQGNLKLCMEGVVPRGGSAPLMDKKWVCLVETPRTLLSQNLIFENLWEHLRVADLFPDEICENKTQV